MSKSLKKTSKKKFHLNLKKVIFFAQTTSQADGRYLCCLNNGSFAYRYISSYYEYNQKVHLLYNDEENMPRVSKNKKGKDI
mgnify:CR=1 FL=1